MYNINIGDFTVADTTYPNRCLSASFGGEVETLPWEGTEYQPYDYKYEDGEFILEPIVIPEPEHIPTAQEDTDAMMLDLELRISLLELGVEL